MRGFADALAAGILALVLFTSLFKLADSVGVDEIVESGEILEVQAENHLWFEMTTFSITLDLDNGSVVICPVPSAKLGGTLYRLYRNRKPELPRLRETARVQVGRHSGSVVCRGLAMANAEQRTGD